MKKILGALCVTLIAAFTTSTAANAKVCESEVFATGKLSLTRIGAKSSSHFAWRREAQDRYGFWFRAWRNAERKSINCGQNVAAGKTRWVCTHAANPCRRGSVKTTPDNGGTGPIGGLPDKTLRQGDQGDGVRTLQAMLNELGYKLQVDGNYGSGTVNAVKDFQKKEGLDADGSVGPQTRGNLEKALG